ncbi:MAG: hypothetical protein GWP59_00815 [Chlamydiales bacterium]|nr:hypothetical protein [Chlamydiales bacterium]
MVLEKSPYSLLNKACKAKLCLDPFPYLVIEEALDSQLYEQIEKAYPDFLKHNPQFKKWNNKRVQIYGADFISNPNFDSVLKDFVAYHLSNQFYKEVCELFSEAISSFHPKLEQRLGTKVSEIKTGIRTQKHSNLFLDCQVGINTPVQEKCSVRGAHLDDKKKFYVGLFYLKDVADISEGGDLLLYKVKDNYPNLDSDPNWGSNVVQDASAIEVVARVPYEANTFIIFLNTPYSFHGVSEREKTPYPRRLINIIGDFSEDVGLYGA